MKRLAAILAAAAVFFALGDAARAITATDAAGTVDVGGANREYLIHVPASYDGRHAVPLVLTFHGGIGRPESEMRISGMNAVADEHGFVVVYPRGLDRHWNDGRSDQLDKPDDVNFVSALIDQLKMRYTIDPKRIFATGISNGAIFSLRLACDLPDTIAAIAPVAGSMPVGLPERCAAKPVSVMMINGSADRFVPYAGGVVGAPGPYQGPVIAVLSTVQFWVKADGCRPTPALTELPDTDPNDGTTTTRQEYGGCRGGTSVQAYLVHGGGHTWPGGWQYLPAFLVGPTSRDFSASEAMWQFFAAHPHQ